MKLINKLLPIATISGITAIVAPLATSCAAGATINAEIEPDTKNWKHYQSDTVDPLHVTKYYTDAIIKDKAIFENDFTWGRNYWYKNGLKLLKKSNLVNDDVQMEVIDFTYTKNKLSFSASSITELFWEDSYLYGAPLVSLTDNVHVAIGTPNVADKQYYDTEIQLDFSVKMVDIPCIIMPSEGLFGEEGTAPFVMPSPLTMGSILRPSDAFALSCAISNFYYDVKMEITQIERDPTTHQETKHASAAKIFHIDNGASTFDWQNFQKELSDPDSGADYVILGSAWFSYYYNGVEIESE